MAFNYEMAFKELEKELTQGTDWAKRKVIEYDEDREKDRGNKEKEAHYWYGEGTLFAYEYLLNFVEGLKVNPYLQKEAEK